jgi:hypothetical protein
MHFGIGEVEAARRHVRHDALFYLRDGQPFASRSALVQAVIAVGEVFALILENADFLFAGDDDSAITVVKVRRFADEPFSHPIVPRDPFLNCGNRNEAALCRHRKTSVTARKIAFNL